MFKPKNACAKVAPKWKIATDSGRYAAGKWGKMLKTRISTTKLYGNLQKSPKKFARVKKNALFYFSGGGQLCK
jgi:hypothetical protein